MRTDERVLIFAVGATLMLCSCKPAVPLAGEVTLEHLGPSGSSRIFLLKNGSPRGVAFRGFSPMLSDVEPLRYDLTCQLASNEAATSFAPMSDYAYSLFAPREKTIDVVPGEQLRVSIFNDFFERFRGKRCRFSLWFEDGSEAKTSEFVP